MADKKPEVVPVLATGGSLPELKHQKLRTYLERIIICVQILDALDMTKDVDIYAAHKEALAIWKETQ